MIVEDDDHDDNNDDDNNEDIMDDDLSSIGDDFNPTNVLGQIIRLQEKVRTQEESKTELLNQCLELQKKVVAVDVEATVTDADADAAQPNTNTNTMSYMNVLRMENKELKNIISGIELNFMNDMKEILDKMKEIKGELGSRDERIRMLENELKMLGCGQAYLENFYESYEKLEA